MNRFSSFALIAVSLGLVTAAVACGDDGTGSGGSGTEATTTTGTTSPTTATSPTTSTGNNQGGGGGTNQGGGGGMPACDGLPTAEATPVLETALFNGTEDLAFDGAGNIVGKDGNEIIGVDADDMVTPIGNLAGQAYGLRYGITGDLFVARPQLGTIVRVAPDGTVTDFATGLAGPNGVYPDLDGNVWVTEFGGGNVLKFDDMGVSTDIATGQPSPNGVVYDPTRDLVFFTQYQAGKVMRVESAGGGTPVEVADIGNAALDGLLMDACGNVYAVDNGQSRLFRIDLDPAGAMIGEPVLLASFPANVANAQFGSGPGWDPNSIYAAGNPGEVYSVPAGVAGAPVATPP